ncbi:MAG: hypothetical protein MZV63_15365 [Marinilabiliales bacterium]|nr:hypothetical protein [Marinilabiliales bacterium]
MSLFDRVIRDSSFSGVVFDDRKGAVSALDKVIDEGYKKIAHFAGYSNISIGMERLEGYKVSLKSTEYH